MINNKIFVIEPMFSNNLILKKELIRYFKNIDFNYKKISKPNLLKRIKNAEGVILGLQPFDKEVISIAKKLKIIVKFGVGMDNVDITECLKNKITIKRAINCNALSVAEMVIANSINIQRNINKNFINLKNKYWRKFDGREIYQKKFGIIGLGSIGKEVAKRLKPFGCQILINDIKVDRKFCLKNKLRSVSFKTILKESDIISLHVPLTNKTFKMISTKELKIIKKNCILINTSRGEVINFTELKKSLRKKKIRLAVDVFPNEPLHKDSIFKNDESIFTPHIGGTTLESKLRIGRKNIQDLKDKFS